MVYMGHQRRYRIPRRDDIDLLHRSSFGMPVSPIYVLVVAEIDTDISYKARSRPSGSHLQHTSIIALTPTS